MSLLVISNLTLRIAGRALLEGANLNIDPGRKVGLIGRNGVGKSTLLAAIAGDIGTDGGEIILSSRARMACIGQEAPSGNLSLLETVLQGDLERTKLLQQAETLDDPQALADVHERLRTIQAESAPARAATILSGLGFDEHKQKQPVSDFSGGWRMRVALATALFLEPDLLLLDEPTNHLDLEATLWLEAWLTRFRGASLIVSHDRKLLDHCVDCIAFLNNGRIALTPGGYDEFVRIRTEQALQQARTAARIEAQRAHMQSFVDRFRAKATKAKQAQARIKALQKLPVIENVVDEASSSFSFPEAHELPPPMMVMEEVVVGYAQKPVLSQISLRIDMGDRIALLGANGNGKSTFAKLLAGRLKPLSGQVRHSAQLKVGYFAQHQAEELIPEETPIQHMQRALPHALPPAVRAQLARFGLDAHRAETKVKNLSGGEKARLLLSLATRDAPHLLILDEPTNHLDLDARDALIRALNDFNGAVLLISHDPHLVELISDQLWLVANGRVTCYDGDIESYQKSLLERGRDPARSPSQPGANITDKKENRKERAELRQAQAPLRNKIRQIEQHIGDLSRKKHKIEAQLASPDIYTQENTNKIVEANKALSLLTEQIAKAEEDWLMAQSKLENQSL